MLPQGLARVNGTALSLSLQNLPSDVLYIIVEQLVSIDGVVKHLKHLSSTSRRIRVHCMPALFRCCWAGESGVVPPQSIRRFVVHLNFTTVFVSLQERRAKGYVDPRLIPYYVNVVEEKTRTPLELPPFWLVLEYLPAVRSITFQCASGGVPWTAILKCLSYPRITSISFRGDSMWTCVTPPTVSPKLLSVGSQLGLTRLHYVVNEWRDVESAMAERDIQAARTLESSYLRSLVLRMSSTAESLTLPIDTAPLTEMSKMDWPRLTALSLTGQWVDRACLQALLLCMPNLRNLSILASQRRGLPHPLILTKVLKQRLHLHSLTIAYPNPEDEIFASIGEELTCLSLRDSPRYYLYPQCTEGWMLESMETPLLTSTDVLSIVKRIVAPRLWKLELVYKADEAEFELLHYLPLAFPLLQQIELHRYRASDDDSIPYLDIAKALTSFEHLRVAYLNLDFQDVIFSPWRNAECPYERSVLLRDRGKEIRSVLEAGRNFECVALLGRPSNAGMWSKYRPSWYPYRDPVWWMDRRAFDATIHTTWSLYNRSDS
ncbi:hypothetical protein C8Q78DRAFT_1026744 [Trametes maxima]|nr:hypothetical protein C8Q78DRAFT_1026744 [Trametes maxima]